MVGEIMYRSRCRVFVVFCSLFLLTKSFFFATELHIDTTVASALEAFQVPGAAVLVVVDGKVILCKGYGLRNQEMHLPVTENTLFAIGSCTKAFTTFVIAQLVDEGKVTWDDPVVKYLPDFSLQDAFITPRVTLRDLACHRSGIPGHDLAWVFSEESRQQLMRKIAWLPPSCDLRERFLYNNLMYMVLGLVIEKVTHQTWEEAVQTRILTPLGMSTTNFSVVDSQKSHDFSSPYAQESKHVFLLPFKPISALGPAGSINSSVHDMTPWLLQQLGANKPLVSTYQLQAMHTLQMPVASPPDGLGYGLGWGISMYKGNSYVSHDGGIDGFVSLVGLFPEQHIGVVILTNCDDGGGTLFCSSVSKTIFDTLLKKDPEDWVTKLQKETPKEEEDLPEAPTENFLMDEYVGQYEHPGYGLVSVTVKEKELIATYQQLTLYLQKVGADAFSGHPINQYWKHMKLPCAFTRDLFGDISALRIPFEPETSPIVFTRKPEQKLEAQNYLAQFVGRYDGPHLSLDVFLVGSELMADLKGRTTSIALIPTRPLYFRMKEYEASRLSFTSSQDGKIQEAILETPSGTFRMKKIGSRP